MSHSVWQMPKSARLVSYTEVLFDEYYNHAIGFYYLSPLREWKMANTFNSILSNHACKIHFVDSLASCW